ncbi:MAG TPA: PrsW family glutamic-type intramembrane protease [Candidatus Omnitrophota bacterium]|nr:PrsW family glutamic-type intramembrane protease [Candidatus Omnitrophota bacterium]
MWSDLLLTAVLPGVVMVAYFHARNEYCTSRGLIQIAYVLGVLSPLLTLLLSGLLHHPSDPADGIYWAAMNVSLFGAAIPEELGKGAMVMAFVWLFRGSRERPHDMVVLGAAVGAGFAANENVLYLLRANTLWVETGILRALMSVPGHVCWGAIMGALLAQREVDDSPGWTAAAFGLPIVLHALYDFPLFVGYFARVTEVDDAEAIAAMLDNAALMVVLVECAAAILVSAAVLRGERRNGMAPATPSDLRQDLVGGAAWIALALVVGVGGVINALTLVENGETFLLTLLPMLYAAAGLHLGYARLTAPVEA